MKDRWVIEVRRKGHHIWVTSAFSRPQADFHTQFEQFVSAIQRPMILTEIGKKFQYRLINKSTGHILPGEFI
jgi:hypothetical protein